MSALLPIKVQQVTIKKHDRILLNQANFEYGASQFNKGITVLMGPNGAGKSLLMRVMAGLIQPDQGTVLWHDSLPNKIRARKLGFVLQRPILFRRSVLANLIYGYQLAGLSKQDASKAAIECLENHQLSHLSHQFAPKISGGEQQRIAILRAMSLSHEVLFLDEPTANLDPTSCYQIEQAVLNIAAQGIPCLFVTHNIQQARRLADYVLYIDHGILDIIVPAADFFKKPASDKAQAFLDGALAFDRS